MSIKYEGYLIDSMGFRSQLSLVVDLSSHTKEFINAETFKKPYILETKKKRTSHVNVIKIKKYFANSIWKVGFSGLSKELLNTEDYENHHEKILYY